LGEFPGLTELLRVLTLLQVTLLYIIVIKNLEN
jgi:hypothetical protein